MLGRLLSKTSSTQNIDKSLLSTRVAKEVGLRVVDVVKSNTQQQAKGGRCPASSTSSSSSIVRTAALLPIQLASRRSSKMMLSLKVGDMMCYDLFIGDDICTEYGVRCIS